MTLPVRVAEVFDAVAELEPAEQRAGLERECGGDPSLRRAVEELLAHDRAATPGFLAPDPAALAQAALGAGGGPEDPTRLGRFYILRKLGEGAMGIVYLGYDEALDRRVAIKVLRRRGDARAWLRREGQALGRLAHPNVVSVYEVSEHEGSVFLTMEFVDGPGLRTWLESERPFADKLRLFIQAGHGLSAVHAAGLIHRDFKPDNVLVGKDGRARVADFGIVGLSEAPEPDRGGLQPSEDALSIRLTRTGALLGTPAFMAPEQFRGERATAASDQWSFCAALYRAAWGVSPYPGASVEELARLVTERPAAPPPHLAEVPSWLAPIVLRGLERDPAARFASMAELLAAIDRHLPRDPELDPTVVARERQLLSAFLLINLAIAGSLSVEPAARVLLRPAIFLAVPAIQLAVLAALIAARWRHLAKNRYGRRLALLFAVGTAATLGNRVVCLELGLQPAPTLVVEAMLFAAQYSCIATLEHPWMATLAVIGSFIAAVGALWPAHAATAYGAGALASVLAMAARLFVDRHLRPEAAIAIGAENNRAA